MVLAFFMHTVSPLPLNILYSQVFELNDEFEDPSKAREIRKDSFLKVALQIQDEYELADCYSNDSTNNSEMNSAEYLIDSTLICTDKKGLFAIPSCNEYFSGSVVLWQSSCNVVYSFILKPSENRLLAGNILKLLITHLKIHAPIVLQPKEVLFKLDKIQAVVNHFLPHGQLLFMTHKVVRQFEKELEKYNKL